MAAHHRRVVGAAIRIQRIRNGFSQEKLAEKADLNPKYLSEVERGRANISLDSLVRISRATGVPVVEFLRDL